MKLIFKILAFLVAALANICEVIAVQQVIGQKSTSFGPAFTAHLFAALLIILAFFLYRVEYDNNKPEDQNLRQPKQEESTGYNNPMAVPAFFISFFMPVFGTLTACIMGFLLQPRLQNESEIFKDYIDYVKTIKEDWPRFDKLSEDQLILKMLEVEPAVDTMDSASKSSVWGSIDNLRRRSDSGAVSLIREVMKKNDVEVKFLASIGLEKMEENFQEQIVEAEKKLEENPTVEAAERYLQASISYLKSGLSSVELNKSLLKKLFSCCDNFLQKDKENAQISFFRAQLLFLDGQKGASLSLIGDMLQKNTLKNEMLLDLAKIAFACGDLEKTLFLLEKIGKIDQTSLDLASEGIEIEREELLEFWFPEKVNHV